MRRWLKVTLAIGAGIVVLLVLNAIVVSNETADAERNVDGGELVETAAGTVQVLDEGSLDGSPIVLIHCYTCSMRWWDELAPLLTQEHRVVRVDLLGHGGSDKPKNGYSMENQAQAVAEALGSLDVTGATVVGHSLGGTVATALAEESPELVSRVVIVDQAADDSFEDSSFAMDLGYKPVIGQALKRAGDIAPGSVIRDQYGIAFAPGFNLASGFENPDQVVDDFQGMTYSAYVDSTDAESDYSGARPLDDRLSALEIPLLVVFGAQDQIYDADVSIERYEDIPGAQTEIIEEAGHSPNVETPELLAPLILAFAAQPTPAEVQAANAAAKAAAKKAAAKKKPAPAPQKAKQP